MSEVAMSEVAMARSAEKAARGFGARTARTLGLGLVLMPGLGCQVQTPSTVAGPPPPVVVAAAAEDTEIRSGFGQYLAGRVARSDRDLGAAADFYRRALAQDPDNVTLQRRTFFLLIADGRISEAVPLAERMNGRNARSGLVPLVLSIEALKQGDAAGALTTLEDVERTGFNALLAPLVKAWAHVARDEAKLAMADLEELSSQPSFTAFKNFHGALIQDYLGDQEQASELFAAALEATSGGTLRIVEAFGSFLERHGRRDEARAIYRAYLERNPNSTVIQSVLDNLNTTTANASLIDSPTSGLAEALFDTASSLVQDNARDAAKLYLQLALYLRPELPLALTMLGEIHESDRRWEDALAAYRRVPADSVYAPNAKIRAAVSLDRLDRTDEAIAILNELANDDPERTEALVTWADLLRRHERYGESVPIYDRAIERVGTFEERHWSLLYARGIALERSRQWARAEADFLRALELKAEEPLVLNYLGYSWVEQGANLDRALAMIERAVELRPDDGYIIDSLGWAHFRLGNFNDAVLYLERAVERRPEDPTINDHLGDAYWRVGRYNEARFQWRRALTLEPEREAVPAIEEKLRAGLSPAPTADKGG